MFRHHPDHVRHAHFMSPVVRKKPGEPIVTVSLADPASKRHEMSRQQLFKHVWALAFFRARTLRTSNTHTRSQLKQKLPPSRFLQIVGVGKRYLGPWKVGRFRACLSLSVWHIRVS